jgi:hypothetical protein
MENTEKNISTLNSFSSVPTNNAAALVAAIVSQDSGITVVPGSEAIVVGSTNQQGLYTGFNLSPSNGVGPSFSLPDGVVLTTGSANFPLNNTASNFSVNSGTGPYPPLQSLAASGGLAQIQFNANALSFDFTVDDLSLNSISVKFLFATDEWPTQSVTDIMGVFVNGVNYAFFEDGTLVSNRMGNTKYFTLNPTGSGKYPIEWNGLTKVYTVVCLINPGEENNITFAISDTSDTVFDSAVFIAEMTAGNTDGGGGIEPPSVTEPPEQTPEPGFCDDRVMVFSICNANAAKDDNYEIYLNDNLLGIADLSANDLVGSIFVGSKNPSFSITDTDFVCPLSKMTRYNFDPSYIIEGTNTVKMKNIQLNNNGNWGVLGIRNYSIDGSVLNSPCYINNLNYSGGNGQDFEFTFEYNQCCYEDPGTSSACDIPCFNLKLIKSGESTWEGTDSSENKITIDLGSNDLTISDSKGLSYWNKTIANWKSNIVDGVLSVPGCEKIKIGGFCDAGNNDCVEIFEQGFIADGQEGNIRRYSWSEDKGFFFKDGSSVGKSPWSINGNKIRIDFENDINCEKYNKNIQKSTCKIYLHLAYSANVTIGWEGKAEVEDSCYERMQIKINGSKSILAHSAGGKKGCDTVEEVVSVPANPYSKILPKGLNIIEISVDTIDPLYHSGAYYEFTIDPLSCCKCSLEILDIIEKQPLEDGSRVYEIIVKNDSGNCCGLEFKSKDGTWVQVPSDKLDCSLLASDNKIIATLLDSWVACPAATPSPTSTPMATPTILNECSLYSWGRNSSGQLGDGTTEDRSLPVYVGEFSQIGNGELHDNFLALKSNGDLYSWGSNNYGQIGNNTIGGRVSTPTLIGSDYIKVSGGDGSSFGIKTNGDLYAWGNNMFGQLGIGDATIGYKKTPTLIGSDFMDISAGEGFTFGIKNNGDLYHWGSRTYSSWAGANLSPTLIGTGFLRVYASEATILIKNNGDAYLEVDWVAVNNNQEPGKLFLGENYRSATAHSVNRGVLYGVKNNNYLYKIVLSGDSATEILLGYDYFDVSAGEPGDGVIGHTLALKTNGDLYAWGNNQFGQVGDGTKINRPESEMILIASGISSISCGDYASYVLTKCLTPTPTPTATPTAT